MGGNDLTTRRKKPADITLTGFLATWERQYDSRPVLCPCSFFRTGASGSSSSSTLLQLHDFCFHATQALAISNTVLTLALIYADRLAQALSPKPDDTSSAALCGCEVFVAASCAANKFLSDDDRTVNSRWASLLSRGYPHSNAAHMHQPQPPSSSSMPLDGVFGTASQQMLYSSSSILNLGGAHQQQHPYSLSVPHSDTELLQYTHRDHTAHRYYEHLAQAKQQQQPQQQETITHVRYVAQLEMRVLKSLDYALYVSPEMFALVRASVEADALTVTWSMLMLEQAGHLPAGYTLAHAPAAASGDNSNNNNNGSNGMGTAAASTTVGCSAAVAPTPSPVPAFYTPPTTFTTATHAPQQQQQRQAHQPIITRALAGQQAPSSEAAMYSALSAQAFLSGNNIITNPAPTTSYYGAAAAGAPVLYAAVADSWASIPQQQQQQAANFAANPHSRASMDFGNNNNNNNSFDNNNMFSTQQQPQQALANTATTSSTTASGTSWRAPDPVLTALTLLMLAHSSAYTTTTIIPTAGGPLPPFHNVFGGGYGNFNTALHPQLPGVSTATTAGGLVLMPVAPAAASAAALGMMQYNTINNNYNKIHAAQQQQQQQQHYQYNIAASAQYQQQQQQQQQQQAPALHTVYPSSCGMVGGAMFGVPSVPASYWQPATATLPGYGHHMAQPMAAAPYPTSMEY